MTKGQKKSHSFIEALLNTCFGFFIAVASQYMIFPIFGIYIPLIEHVYIGLFFTLVSIVRGYVLRRLFNKIQLGELK